MKSFESKRNSAYAQIGIAVFLAAAWNAWVPGQVNMSIISAAEQVLGSPSRYVVTPDRIAAFFAAARTLWGVAEGTIVLNRLQNGKDKK